jgi:hypothetical protein
MMYDVGLNIGLNMLLIITYQVAHYIYLIILWNFIVDSF